MNGSLMFEGLYIDVMCVTRDDKNNSLKHGEIYFAVQQPVISTSFELMISKTCDMKDARRISFSHKLTLTRQPFSLPFKLMGDKFFHTLNRLKLTLQ